MMARHPRDQPVSNMFKSAGIPHLWKSSCAEMGRLLRLTSVARKTHPISETPYAARTARGALLIALTPIGASQRLRVDGHDSGTAAVQTRRFRTCGIRCTRGSVIERVGTKGGTRMSQPTGPREGWLARAIDAYLNGFDRVTTYYLETPEGRQGLRIDCRVGG
jgi:hypothetical protein